MRVQEADGSSTFYYLLSDHLGSTSVTVDADGDKVAELRYKPWGEVRYESGTTPTDYTFTGQRSETESFGLMYYNARWFVPELGRFAQADTIIPGVGKPVAWDRFAYGYNNPSRFTDPSGNICVDTSNGQICTDDDDWSIIQPVEPRGYTPPKFKLEDVPFDNTLGGNFEDPYSSNEYEVSPNPPIGVLVAIWIPLHLATIVTEWGIVEAEMALAPFAFAYPVIGVPLGLLLGSLGVVVLDIDVAYSIYVYRVYTNPQEKQELEFLPPWGLDE
jgi:RHS repeat-associated protein